MILVSPQEPPSLVERLAGASGVRALVHPLPEVIWGVDVLCLSTAYGCAGVQRKEWPGDFRSSLDDGRLALFLRKSRELDHRLLVLEGEMPQWHERSGVSEERLRGTLFSLEQYHRVGIAWTRNLGDTVETVAQWTRWLGHPHGSLENRPKANDAWNDPFSRTRRSWLLEALPGIGNGLANRILDHCGMPVSWTGPDPLTIPGIGPKRAHDIRRFFDHETSQVPARKEDQ